MCQPVMVVARGELMVVHLKMHRLRRKAWDAETSRKSCRYRQDVAGRGHIAEQDAVHCAVHGACTLSEYSSPWQSRQPAAVDS